MNSWYTNEDWNPEIEQTFFAKLARTRSQRAQYLKIQAGALCRTHPEAALMLLDRYFALDDSFFLAEAYLHRAQAYVALSNFEEAAVCYQSAISREEKFPNYKTLAAFEFPLFVAMQKMRHQYGFALHVIEKSRRDILFPSQRFDSCAARALIASDLGEHERATAYAEQALVAASSGAPFPRHPTVGLVGPSRAAIMATLNGILSRSTQSEVVCPQPGPLA